MTIQESDEPVIEAKLDRSARNSRYLAGIFLMLLLYGLYLGRDFLTPVVLAFLLALTLTPIVRFLSKWAIPPAVSATILIIASTGTLGILGYVTSGPISQLISDAPRISATLQERVHSIRMTVDKAVRATSQIDEAAETISDANVQKVVVAQPGIVSRAAGSLLSVGTTLAITLVLSLFLLASGTLFYEKLIQSFSLMSDKKRALRVIYSVEREISRYLFTITLINGGLGVVVGAGLWLLGIPNALVWGVTAAVLNFLPYIGALVTIVVVAVISLATFTNIAFALVAPAFVLCCNIIEGQFITPLMLGRRLELNPVAVFISISFWSWIWGFVGALLAVPLLVIIKVVSDHFETLKPFGNFLSAQQTPRASSED
jgi:predicted PurR-regulated permease PerM